MKKHHDLITSAMLCLNSHKFSTSILARYVVQVLKAVTILTGECWNVSTLLVVVSYFLSARVSTERRLKLGFPTQKKCSFPLFSLFPLTEETNRKSTWSFLRGPLIEVFVCPKGKVPLYILPFSIYLLLQLKNMWRKYDTNTIQLQIKIFKALYRGIKYASTDSTKVQFSVN